MHKRLKILGIFLIIMWGGLAYRLFYIQIYKSSNFKLLAQTQHLRETEIDSYRGDILDRNGQKLATDLTYYSFAANPKQVTEKWKLAATLSKHFGKSRDHYLSLLKRKKSFIWLERKVNAFESDKISQYNFKGLQRFTDYKRFYPYGDVAGQITGFTDIDNVGIEGLEYRYNKILSGEQGSKTLTSDALGRKKTDFDYPIKDPVTGNTVVTTIDIESQIIVLDELRQGVEKYHAKAGMAVLMEPTTGEIRAMASIPNFDSNDPGAFNASLRRNRVVTDSFEPGSIFKIVPIAAALEDNIVSANDVFFCENGHIYLGSRRFRDTKPHGDLTVKEIMELSSNIGTYKIAELLGTERYYAYIKKFGFGKKIGFETGGETAGLVRHPSKWTKLSLPSISIGQEISVNALQIVSAYSAVANGGVLMKPFLIKSVLDNSGNIIEESTPKMVRRVISDKTAKTLMTFFEGVVDHGTATTAKIPGRSIAGKTGTAQKIDTKTKSLSQTDYMSSFVAIYPSDDPKLVGIVVLDTPKPQYYGGTVAAPIMKNIINRIMRLPSNNILAERVRLANVKSSDDKSLWQKIQTIWQRDAGDNTASGSLSPNADGKTNNHLVDVNKLKTPAAKNTKKETLIAVPDLKGKSIREAINILIERGLDFELKGAGNIKGQSPKPGTKVKPGTKTIIRGQKVEEIFDKRKFN